MSNFLSTTGAVIATYIGTGISIASACVAFFSKRKIEKYKDELQIRIQDKELSQLIENGNKAKTAALNFSTKKRKTSTGQQKEDADKQIKDFLSGINENKHLIKAKTINKLYKAGKEHLKKGQYDELFYTISDVISLLRKLSDSNLTR